MAGCKVFDKKVSENVVMCIKKSAKEIHWSLVFVEMEVCIELWVILRQKTKVERTSAFQRLLDVLCMLNLRSTFRG